MTTLLQLGVGGKDWWSENTRPNHKPRRGSMHNKIWPPKSMSVWIDDVSLKQVRRSRLGEQLRPLKVGGVREC